MIAPMLNVVAQLVIANAIPPTGTDAGILLSAAEITIPGAVTVLPSRDSSGIRIDWQVTKQIGPSPDTATITVYNLADTTAKQLSIMATIPFSPVRCRLSIGWGELLDVVFKGESWKMIPRQRSGVDVLTIIEAGDGIGPIHDTSADASSLFKAAAGIVVAKLLTDLKLQPSKTALAMVNAAAAKVPALAAFSFVGSANPRDTLNDLLATMGLTWGIVDGEFVVYSGGLRNDLLPSILTPETGLLEWHEIELGGVEFEALAQARVVPGMQLQVLDDLGVMQGGGPLRVERVEFHGSTYSTSLMNGVARKLKVLG